MVSRVDLYPRVEIATAVVAVVIGLASYAIATGVRAPAAGLPPSLVTVLLVANLTPLMVLITLIARRLALLVGQARKSVVLVQSVSVRVDLDSRCILISITLPLFFSDQYL